MNKIFYIVKKINPEAWVWLAGLTVLAFLNPDNCAHYSICPFKNLGFKYCPGCGLGHSITYFFHGNIKESIQTHILGIPAVLILTSRIISLIIETFSGLQFNNHKIERDNTWQTYYK